MKDTHRQISQESSDIIVKKLVGTPYKELDCYGIIREFYCFYGIELKKYYETYPDNQENAAKLIAKYAQDFERVQKPEYGDIIILNLLGFPSHCALYLSEGKMLHTNSKVNCIVDKIERWQTKIEGYYRLK